MAASGRRLPLGWHPLIAEAKRRTRRRRLLLAVIVLVLAGGTVGATEALNRSSPARRTALTPASSQLPPLSSLAARAQWCGDAYNASGHGGCHSPDGKWAVVVNNEGRGCTLTVTGIGTDRHKRFGQPGSGGCAPDLWIDHSFVIQEGIYGPRGRVVSLSPPSRHVQVLAHFGTFVVSPNERWIAGETTGHTNPYGAREVVVMSLATQRCLVVTKVNDPNRFVSVDKSPWSLRPLTNPPSPTFNDPVVWRKVVEGGKKISVVTGPGTGFTRNSRSVIVAEWQWSTSQPRAPIHKRLRRFDLSSLHTPCPAGLVPRS
jgi:hypothetical protein